jgi:eukaryotic-like serine/threonine-protein kinase
VTRFVFGRRLGAGAFGIIDEAARVDSDGEIIEHGFVRKQLALAIAGNPQAHARFLREVRIVDEMSHPNIIEIVDRDLSAHPPWFIMPRAESTLLKEIESGKYADDAWVAASFSAVLVGMSYAHKQRRIHRDLKPENILRVNGVLKIADFGLGKSLESDSPQLTGDDKSMGSWAYMAPEQHVDAAHVGPPADVFALGKLLYHMLTGKKPTFGPPPFAEITDPYRTFVEKCTGLDPVDRYANATDAYAGFRLLAGGDDTRLDGRLEALIAEWDHTPLEQDQRIVATIASFLVAELANEPLYWTAFARLPDQLIEQLIRDHSSEFDEMLRAYDRHTQGALPFEYCDVVANLYRRIYKLTSVAEQKRLVLKRLVILGSTHNRGHVGDVVARMLQDTAREPDVALAAEVIAAHPTDATWFAPFIRNRELPIPILRAFDSARPELDGDSPY